MAKQDIVESTNGSFFIYFQEIYIIIKSPETMTSCLYVFNVSRIGLSSLKN